MQPEMVGLNERSMTTQSRGHMVCMLWCIPGTSVNSGNGQSRPHRKKVTGMQPKMMARQTRALS